MTYAEYMASKGGKKEESIREVENEFKNMKAAAKVEEDFFSLGGGKKKKEKKQSQGKQTIQANFRVVRTPLFRLSLPWSWALSYLFVVSPSHDSLSNSFTYTSFTITGKSQQW